MENPTDSGGASGYVQQGVSCGSIHFVRRGNAPFSVEIQPYANVYKGQTPQMGYEDVLDVLLGHRVLHEVSVMIYFFITIISTILHVGLRSIAGKRLI